MKQRLGIAAALLNDPHLLILDEPANGLDPAGIHELRNALRRLVEETDRTIVVSSHILPEVQQLADVVGIIDQGKLVHQGSLEQLLATSGAVRVRVAPAEVEPARAILAAMPGADPATGPVADGEGWISVRAKPDMAAAVNRALAEGGIYASGLETGSDLEAIFLSLTGGPNA
jgi:ABC-2 type transport system ATP-binding protein